LAFKELQPVFLGESLITIFPFVGFKIRYSCDEFFIARKLDTRNVCRVVTDVKYFFTNVIYFLTIVGRRTDPVRRENYFLGVKIQRDMFGFQFTFVLEQFEIYAVIYLFKFHIK